MNENFKTYIHKNNFNLTPNRDFNCGGFAFGLIEWYKPYKPASITHRRINNIRSQYYADEISFDECCDRIADLYIDFMCNDKRICVREIHSYKELAPNENLVVFRASDDDFHYARYFGNGEWYHKAGGWHIERVTTIDIIDYCENSCVWHNDKCLYGGKLRLLAVIDK